MKKILRQVERNCISGALVLLPLVVFFMILKKVWFFFQNYGEKAAHLFRFDQILGVFASDIIGGILLLLLLYFSGYLLHLTYIRKFTGWIDDKLMVFLPGYEKNKKIAEDKLKAKEKKASTDLPVLLKNGDYWQPAHLIEEGEGGSAVVFVPAAPSKEHGQIFLVSAKDIKRLPNSTLAEIDGSIKSRGRGLIDLS
ncbi:hypothetical protein [Flavobacterium phragmitis]|uniref:Uncharacterized membrane protein n=1 Tax=Flavobacterium phragmitis TaxID=739143 RepID=A0A1I1LWF0_9FLAO|nr:hypothetical protein [Flavobacterium phragmitis]SFC75268.1 Uncharacterized membrane protein [Flavobacterium phragmitis]